MSESSPVHVSINPARIAKDVLEENPGISKSDFASECVERIPTTLYRAFLTQFFYSTFSQFVGTNRNAETERVKNPPINHDRTQPEALTFLDIDTDNIPRVGPARYKLDNFWRQRVPVGTVYKFLSDLTVDDLAIVAELRYSMAAANNRKGDEYNAIREYMVKHKLKTAGEVEDEVAKRLLKSLSE